jgi:hypothetical protein
MSLQTLLEESSDTELLREMIAFATQRLMELEVEGPAPAMANAVPTYSIIEQLPGRGGDPGRHGRAAHPAVIPPAWSSAESRSDAFRAASSALPALNLGLRKAATVTRSPIHGLAPCPAAG